MMRQRRKKESLIEFAQQFLIVPENLIFRQQDVTSASRQPKIVGISSFACVSLLLNEKELVLKNCYVISIYRRQNEFSTENAVFSNESEVSKCWTPPFSTTMLLRDLPLCMHSSTMSNEGAFQKSSKTIYRRPHGAVFDRNTTEDRRPQLPQTYRPTINCQPS